MHTQKTGWLSNIGMQVVIAMIIGAAVGALMGESAAVFAPLGAIFIHLIKMLVVPLVAVRTHLYSFAYRSVTLVVVTLGYCVPTVDCS